MEYFVNVLERIPIFNNNKNLSAWSSSEILDVDYTLYDNIIGFRVGPVTQPKIFTQGLRLI